MRKFYLLSFLLCSSLASFGQATTFIYATGAPGSYTTASSSTSTRTEGIMIAIPFTQRAYAIFDLAANLPSGANILTADLGFNIEDVTGTGSAGSAIRGYNGQLSAITTPSVLYGQMASPPATGLYTTTWASAIGDDVIPSSASAVSFLQNCFSGGSATGFASIIWAAGGGGPGGGLTYTITGESGTATTTGAHAPYLKLTYNCPGLATTATGPTSTLCANTSFALTGSATGASSYSWSGPGGFTSTMASPTVTGGFSVTGTYTLTAYTAEGCPFSDLVTVPINPAPNTTITPLGSTAFCSGDNVSLSVPTAAGNTYQWYNNGVLISGATDPSYTTSVTGTYKVQVTDAASCTATTAVGTPTKMFDPAATALTPLNPVMLCSGDVGLMSVDVNGVTSGINYQWQQSGAAITGATNSSYSTSVAGHYNVVITIPATTCTVNSDTDTVVVNAYPVPVITPSSSMIKTSNTYAIYQWFLNTIAIPGATTYAITPTSNGNYIVKVTDTNGCTAFSSQYAVHTAGVGQLNKEDVSIYPNPAAHVLHIESPEAVRAIITSVEGRILVNQADAKDVNISRLATGTYIITLYDDKGERVAVRQFVKE